MGIKDTVDWAKSEWGIITQRDSMTLGERARWLRQWVPFGFQTIGYGTFSCVLGPLTADHKASLWAMKRWSRASLKASDITAEISGTEHIPDGAVMYAANHQSLLDILVLGAVLPGDFKWAAKSSLLRVPFLGWHLKLSGHVPVDRSAGRRGTVQAIKGFTEVLKEGKHLLIFPEGTRSESGEIRPFKNGGFYAAVRAGRPVIPVAIDGTRQMMIKGAADSGSAAERRHVIVRLGPPIMAPTEGKEGARVSALRESTRDAIVAMHAVIRQEYEAS
jgi:1-acyl-sn-glycerol-3-phosphate acyltransferase